MILKRSFSLFVLSLLANEGKQDRVSVPKHLLLFAPVSLLVLSHEVRCQKIDQRQ